MINNENSETESVFEEFENDSYKVSATNGARFANYIIDTIMLYVCTIIIVLVFTTIYMLIVPTTDFLPKEDNNSLFEYVIGAVMGVIYFTTLEYFTGGRSIGKYITKTKVITIDGKKPGFIDCLVRSLCRYIPFEPFSFFSGTDCAWHDSISKTRVIKI